MWGSAGALVNLGSSSSLGPGKISLAGGNNSDIFALEYAGMAQAPPRSLFWLPWDPSSGSASTLFSAESHGGGEGLSLEITRLEQVTARFWMEGGSLAGRVVLCARYCTSLFKVFLMCV